MIAFIKNGLKGRNHLPRKHAIKMKHTEKGSFKMLFVVLEMWLLRKMI